MSFAPWLISYVYIFFAMQKGDALVLMIDQLRMLPRCRRMLQPTRREYSNTVSPRLLCPFILTAAAENRKSAASAVTHNPLTRLPRPRRPPHMPSASSNKQQWRSQEIDQRAATRWQVELTSSRRPRSGNGSQRLTPSSWPSWIGSRWSCDSAVCPLRRRPGLGALPRRWDRPIPIPMSQPLLFHLARRHHRLL